MTLTLYGNDACTACKEAQMLLGRTPLDWKYDVSTIDYNGEVPALILEDGRVLIGLGAINHYVKEQGF